MDGKNLCQHWKRLVSAVDRLYRDYFDLGFVGSCGSETVIDCKSNCRCHDNQGKIDVICAPGLVVSERFDKIWPDPNGAYHSQCITTSQCFAMNN